MRIAQIAPIIERVPPKKYGGSERVINVLTEGLVKRGHDVTLFASGDSLTSAKLISVIPKSLKETNHIDPYGANAQTALHTGLAYKMQDKFDIIHDHIGVVTLPMANLAKTPVVSTMHGPFTPELKELYSSLTNPYVVTISDAQYKIDQGPTKFNHIGTVYNGLNMDNYPFSETSDGYLLFVGRITHDKGVHTAIKVAQQLNLPLIIAAKLETAFQPDLEYFETKIKPHLSDKIRWIGEVTEKQRNQLMSKALCFLHPIYWPEPFGLTIIESMACGAPVVAFGLGSIPELIVDGKSGFIIQTTSQMIQAVKNIDKINRSKTRQHALANFSGDRMVEGYLDVYNKILAETKPTTERVSRYFDFGMPLIPDLSSRLYQAESKRNFRFEVKQLKLEIDYLPSQNGFKTTSQNKRDRITR
jgi:glycosyltransferase involved in cell wall biosynthesis